MKLTHVLKAGQFTDIKYIEKLLDLAAQMEAADRAGTAPQTLKGKIVASIFYEPSSRTRLSFETAVNKLGGQVITAESAKSSSSAVKGESLQDSMRVFSSYADAIVFRHPTDGSAEIAASASSVPLINAGDGGNEHPTQALLDLYTIRKALGRLDHLHVAFGFDPKHSRTIRSLALLLSQYPGNRFTFISPESLRLAPELMQKLKTAGVSCAETTDLTLGLDADILYLNRLQQERFTDMAEFEKNRKLLVLTAEKIKGKKALVMDPLPRIDEITADVDALPNAIYFQQVKNGLYLRMALLQEIFS